MHSVLRSVVVTAAFVGAAVVPTGTASATGSGPAAPVSVGFADSSVTGLSMATDAAEGTKTVLESDSAAAVAAANVCGSGYTISVGAARYGTYGTAYAWWNGEYSGSNTLYDRPICGVFFNDTGAKHYMGVRLKDNYTATADTQDFGSYSTYAGPVYQDKGYCGSLYSYMEDAAGNAVVDNYTSVGTCN
ncbi:hypothetical protein [Streptomyces sp. NPDC047000]|uniref:hypothetical protein n=1 Tax=Streptomyces sp. NPDC047000 TaxID=3155474 RepID=UPI0033F64188